jgi:hypothetical protein
MAQKKENVCFAAAFFSFALIISRFVALLLAAAIAAIVIVIRRSPEICKQLPGSLALIIS